MPPRSAPTALWALLVAVVISAAMIAGAGIIQLAGIPQRPDIPLLARSLGAAVALAGLALGAWTLAHHPPTLMLRVTARTIEVGLRKLPPGAGAVPKLITTGPYKHIRNPTYAAVFLVITGLGIALPFMGLIAGAFLLFAWWNFVVTPREEKELAALFGDEYTHYRATTCKFVPGLY